jgi:hypothetical protein
MSMGQKPLLLLLKKKTRCVSACSLGKVGISNNPECSGEFEKPRRLHFVQMGVVELI